MKTRRITGLALQALILVSALAQERVNVHFVPHSHMDAGWRETYDGYYQSKVH